MKARISAAAVLALLLSLLLFGCSQNEPDAVSVVAPVTGVSFALGSQSLSGAIFTTTVNGDIVNENVHYKAKEDVYLDGGPGPNAPVGAAGLPEGDYFFQVTDPSGKDLLSTDHISCRQIHINDHGVISLVYEGTNYEKKQGNWEAVAFQHAQGVDEDHSAQDAITVQLFPYDDTPNKGGVYKVWVTPVDHYLGDPAFVPTKMNDPVNGEYYAPGNYHGFDPRWSKTDNYKVREHGTPPVTPPEITIIKFHDANLNGVKDAGEAEVTGWAVDVTDPLAVTNTVYTPASVLAILPGNYTTVEATPAGTMQTVSRLDGSIVSSYPTANPTVVVSVAGNSGETHQVVYGNVGVGSVTACKVYDRDGDGIADEGEPGIAGWAMQLTGTDALGSAVGPVTQYTGDDGCTTFSGLLPGSYTLTELVPLAGNWVASGATTYTFEIVSTLDGSVMSGGSYSHTFTNYCYGEADFGTKGYWHNKNGLAELTAGDIAAVNALAPYSSPSNYFDAGDEPFNGLFAGGSPVDGMHGEAGDEIAPAGSWQAEVSHFLVDTNAGADPREQLAQQLLAFIFNVQHRLDGGSALIELPDGSVVSAQSVIDDAIAAWVSGSASSRNAMAGLLDAMNNNDDVHYVHAVACSVTY